MKVLCIEDNKALVDSLRQFLGAGSQITSTASGRKGLKLADKNQYDVVVLDLGLPDMSGLDVCLELRQRDARLPILILSGSKDSETKVTLLEAGADDYLAKHREAQHFLKQYGGITKP